MINKKNWMYISICAIILSVVSLFLPIIVYYNAGTGSKHIYNILSLLDTSDIIYNMFAEYHGTENFYMYASYETVSFLIILICLIGVAAIVTAFFGIKTMTKQYESVWPFRLTICGLIGTAIPSLVLLIMYFVAKNQFAGTLQLGAYIFVTPIAMLIACVNVTNRHRLTQEEASIQAEACKYIRPAGDLTAGQGQQTKNYSTDTDSAAVYDEAQAEKKKNNDTIIYLCIAALVAIAGIWYVVSQISTCEMVSKSIGSSEDFLEVSSEAASEAPLDIIAAQRALTNGYITQEDIDYGANALGNTSVCRIDSWIYYTDSYLVYRISAEGSTWQKLDFPEEYYYYEQLYAYNGYLYMKCYKSNNESNNNIILQFDPQSNEFEEIISVLINNNAYVDTYINSYCITDDHIYYLQEVMFFELDEEDGNTYNWYDSEYSLYKASLYSGHGKTCLHTLSDEYEIEWLIGLSYFDGKLYFAAYSDSYEGELLAFDVNEGTLESICGCDSRINSVAVDNGIAYIQSLYDIHIYDLDTGEETIAADSGYGDEWLYSMNVTDDYIVYSTDALIEYSDGSTWQRYGIYTYDIAVGSIEKVFDDFCEVIGVSGNWIYFWDESGIDDCDSWDEYMFYQKLCRIRIDGTGYMELPVA